MSSAVPTIYVAVDTAFLADATLMAMLVDRGVWAIGDVPPNQRLDNSDETAPNPPTRHGYIELGTSRETAAHQFATDANDDGLRLTVRATSKKWALTIFREMKRVAEAPLPSGVMAPDSQSDWERDVSFIEDFQNPDGGHSAVGDLAVSVVSTA